MLRCRGRERCSPQPSSSVSSGEFQPIRPRCGATLLSGSARPRRGGQTRQYFLDTLLHAGCTAITQGVQCTTKPGSDGKKLRTNIGLAVGASDIALQSLLMATFVTVSSCTGLVLLFIPSAKGVNCKIRSILFHSPVSCDCQPCPGDDNEFN